MVRRAHLERSEVEALIRAAPHADAAMVMLTQWRAGLRGRQLLQADFVRAIGEATEYGDSGRGSDSRGPS